MRSMKELEDQGYEICSACKGRCEVEIVKISFLPYQREYEPCSACDGEGMVPPDQEASKEKR
jgi:DnaJ-class molecular chaperone